MGCYEASAIDDISMIYSQYAKPYGHGSTPRDDPSHETTNLIYRSNAPTILILRGMVPNPNKPLLVKVALLMVRAQHSKNVFTSATAPSE